MGEVHGAKRECHMAEYNWRRSNHTVYKQIYQTATDNVAFHIEQAKMSYYDSKLESADQGSVFKIAGELLHKGLGFTSP